MHERNRLLRSYGLAGSPVIALPQGDPPPAQSEFSEVEKAPR